MDTKDDLPKLLICGDSFADVSTKALFTDISGLFFLNFLNSQIKVVLNGHYIGDVPAKSQIYLHNGFNLEDVLTFTNSGDEILGKYHITDRFVRRLSIRPYL